MSINNDPLPLMRQLAAMAGMPEGKIRRMVLVLDAEDVPRLFVESYLGYSETPLQSTQLEVEERPVVVDITTIQNRVFVTKTTVRNEPSLDHQSH